jgi:putative transcriptional regulator
MRVKSNLKTVLDERQMSIRELAARTGLPFETVRRLYNDDTKQYQRDTIGMICDELKIDLSELLILSDSKE